MSYLKIVWDQFCFWISIDELSWLPNARFSLRSHTFRKLCQTWLGLVKCDTSHLRNFHAYASLDLFKLSWQLLTIVWRSLLTKTQSTAIGFTADLICELCRLRRVRSLGKLTGNQNPGQLSWIILLQRTLNLRLMLVRSIFTLTSCVLGLRNRFDWHL